MKTYAIPLIISLIALVNVKAEQEYAVTVVVDKHDESVLNEVYKKFSDVKEMSAVTYSNMAEEHRRIVFWYETSDTNEANYFNSVEGLLSLNIETFGVSKTFKEQWNEEKFKRFRLYPSSDIERDNIFEVLCNLNAYAKHDGSYVYTDRLVIFPWSINAKFFYVITDHPMIGLLMKNFFSSRRSQYFADGEGCLSVDNSDWSVVKNHEVSFSVAGAKWDDFEFAIEKLTEDGLLQHRTDLSEQTSKKLPVTIKSKHYTLLFLLKEIFAVK